MTPQSHDWIAPHAKISLSDTSGCQWQSLPQPRFHFGSGFLNLWVHCCFISKIPLFFYLSPPLPLSLGLSLPVTVSLFSFCFSLALYCAQRSPAKILKTDPRPDLSESQAVVAVMKNSWRFLKVANLMWWLKQLFLVIVCIPLNTTQEWNREQVSWLVPAKNCQHRQGWE